MDENDQRTFSRFMQMMNDLHHSELKHIDFGDNLFHVRSESSTETTMDIFPERDDSWSIIWYIASFSGLIAFFLIVSCSEWCCRLHVRGPAQAATTQTLRPSSSSLNSQTHSFQVQETPPPAYDLFAPPSYESVRKASIANTSLAEKSLYDVYVVPVHAISMLAGDTQTDGDTRQNQVVEDDPPSYISVQMNNSTIHLPHDDSHSTS